MKATPRPFQTTLAGVLAPLSISSQVIAQHPLDSWVRRTAPTPNSALNGIAYGNGTFVAVGDNSFVARSTDGITWTTSTAGAYGKLKRVRFLNGQFVVVGESDKIMYSSDGTSWTANTLPRADFWDIALGDGIYVLAGASTYVSADGFNWTQTHPMLKDAFNTLRETPLDTVVSGNGGFQALPMALPYPNSFRPRQTLFSTNGIDWIAGGFGQAGLSGGGGELLYQDGAWLSVVDGNPM